VWKLKILFPVIEDEDNKEGVDAYNARIRLGGPALFRQRLR